MRRGGIRTAVIHGRTDGHAGGHLVVEETAHFFAEEWSEGVVEFVIVARFAGVDAAGQIAFEQIQDGLEFFLRIDDDGESGVAEDLALEIVGRSEELIRTGT